MFDHQAGDIWGRGTLECVVFLTQILLNLFLSNSSERSPDLIVLPLGAAFLLTLHFPNVENTTEGKIEEIQT